MRKSYREETLHPAGLAIILAILNQHGTMYARGQLEGDNVTYGFSMSHLISLSICNIISSRVQTICGSNPYALRTRGIYVWYT